MPVKKVKPAVNDNESILPTDQWLIIENIKITVSRYKFFLQDENFDLLVDHVVQKYLLNHTKAFSYCRQAVDQVKALFPDNLMNYITHAIIDRENLILKAYEENNIKLVLDIMKDRDRLLNLYSNSDMYANDEIDSLSIDELRKMKSGLAANA